MKCPFCPEPCGNTHCPYYEDDVEVKTANIDKGLKEECDRLREYIKQLERYISKKETR